MGLDPGAEPDEVLRSEAAPHPTDALWGADGQTVVGGVSGLQSGAKDFFKGQPRAEETPP